VELRNERSSLHDVSSRKPGPHDQPKSIFVELRNGAFVIGCQDRVPSIASMESKTNMITEIAQIEVKPGQETEFEAAVKKAAPIFKRTKGCHGMELRRSIEKPSRYRLLVNWETLEDHTVGFRNSPEFQEWRGLVGHYFASPPEVEHVQQVVHGF
jgi:heme-degrading monooxygenase HmoA